MARTIALVLLLALLAHAGAAPEWHRPRFREREAERARMAKKTIQNRGVKEEGVLAAMRAVPRHCFVPDSMQRSAYEGTPLPIDCGQTISQPYMVAYMTERLGLGPKKKVLEVGTGSGYQAAVLAELTPNVYTIEIYEKLGKKAAGHFRRLGYKTIRAKVGDGYFGWKEHAPFDAIIVTCAATHIPPPLLAQLAPGGKMIVPVGSRFAVQKLIVVEKDAHGKVTSRADLPVRFVPLLGGHSRKK